MWVKCLGLALLVWIPAVLHAQQECRAPSLDDGYFVPKKPVYAHEEEIIYSCNNTFKPVVEGWWATSACQNGEWVHKPQCIHKQACVQPTVPNAKLNEGSRGWHGHGTSTRITCKDGYEVEGSATADCVNGQWLSLPVCKKQPGACAEPPYIPNAVVQQKYQEVFPHGSKVRYICIDGYAMERGKAQESVECKDGTWEGSPECKPSPGSGVDAPPVIVTIDRCGAFPLVQNGDFILDGLRALTYKCAVLYQRIGPEKVMCYSNGDWSEVPTCIADYCSVNTEDYPDLKNDGVRFLSNGQTERLDCEDKWIYRNYALVKCNNGIAKISQCCNSFQLAQYCWSRGTMTN